MTGRARFWLATVALTLAVVVVASRAQALRASAQRTSALAVQTLSLGRELRAGQDALATALGAVDAGRFDEADRQLTRARTLLAHAHEQLISLGLSNESGHVLALLEGIEVARGLIVRGAIARMSAGVPHEP